jgi:hypothetical protein
MHRLPLLVTALLTIAGFGVYAGAGAAGAATVRNRQAPQHYRYCIAEAVPIGSAQHAAVRCYPSFAASVRAATSGRVHLKASAAPRSVTPDQLNAGRVTPATTYVLSIDFQNSDFGGNSFVWYQTSKCGSFQTASMPSGWNDVISSVIAESGCATTLFWNANFGSPTYQIGRNGSAASLGSFNDQTSSQTWCPRQPCNP